MGMIGPIECQTIDEMKSVLDTNFFGLVRLLKEILPDMKQRKSGHIVVISSEMGIQGELLKITQPAFINDWFFLSRYLHLSSLYQGVRGPT